MSFCIGAAIAAANYAISRYALKKHPSTYAATQILRQIILIIFLTALYVLGGYTPWDRIWLLAGGAFGVTLPTIWFTIRLVKLNDVLRGKEEKSDG